MKKLELVPNSAKGLDLIVERDAGNPVRILTGKNSLEFFKELKRLCDDAIKTLNSKKFPGPDSKEFAEWKVQYAKEYPAEFAVFNDEALYDIFTTE